MRRLTDNDKNWGPFTWALWSKTFSLTIASSGDDEDNPNQEYNIIRVIAFGRVLQVRIPCMIKPLKVKQMALSWDEETVKRMGRNWYYNVYPRVYGFSLSDMGNGYDFIQVFFGPRTDDSKTEKLWCRHLPWKQWDCVRHSIYAPDGTHFYTEKKGEGFQAYWDQKEACPKCPFGFEDFDGELIVATLCIEEREWHKGEGWFKWLRWFSRPKIRRSLDLQFSAEVGPEKGSWKGGTIGTGCEMLPGETPRQAFERYCAMEHSRKGRKYSLRFGGPIDPDNVMGIRSPSV